MRQNRKRTAVNLKKKVVLKEAVKKALVKKDAQLVGAAYKLADKAVKAGVIHRNKARRIKSRLARSLS